MIFLKKIFFGTVCSFACASALYAQDPVTPDHKPDLKEWHLKDLSADSFYGISLNQAYQYLKNKKSKPTIVAIIDSGIDTTHEDLRSKLWVNTGEIPGNGIDDDKNGYIDDVHGWNFLGNANGKNVDKAAMEKVRLYHSYRAKYERSDVDTSLMTPEEKYRYRTWERAKSDMEDPQKKAELEQMLNQYAALSNVLQKGDSILQASLGKKVYNAADLENASFSDPMANRSKMMMLQFMQLVGGDSATTNESMIHDLTEEFDSKKGEYDGLVNAPKDVRAEIIGDDYFNFKDRHYGNNDINGPDPKHGTHVAGIIGAREDDKAEVRGVADNVQLMIIRAVPDGDEYDKDIALAIRYAVDNGAKVINMSFGKSYSPEKYWVDSAFAYAASKDVLLVHAAGNEGVNLDSSFNFPSTQLLFPKESQATNVITVGASGDKRIESGNLVASFSNYGKKSVDVFAPGVKIYSTIPVNQYAFLQGTSMASPVVAGLAGLIRSYFPELSALQVKKAIESSVFKPLDKDIKIPGDGTAEVSLADISVYGGIVNAASAVKYASTLKPEHHKASKNKASKRRRK